MYSLFGRSASSRLFALLEATLLTSGIALLADPAEVYVDTQGSHTFPYTNWLTAATNLQTAVDTVDLGGTVWVSNGVYSTGGRAVHGTMTNRVAIDRAITVRSVNGPEVTVIEGRGVGPAGNDCGDGAIRCAYVTNGAALIGFTLTNGHTRSSGDLSKERSGGGALCTSSGLITGCILAGNRADYYGGGVHGGLVRSGVLRDNEAYYGGGAAGISGTACQLVNCTLIGNSAFGGGGSYQATMYNSIAYYNDALLGTNYSGGTIGYSCTTPAASGTGNIVSAPGLADAAHLLGNSPCIGAGSATNAAGADIDGDPWQDPPCIGCDQYLAGSATGALAVAILATDVRATVGVSLALEAGIIGHATANRWDFGDGTVLSNNLYAGHSWAATGSYPVVLTAYNSAWPGGVSATSLVLVTDQPVYFVAKDNPGAQPPYATWATAAASIQDAVEAATQVGSLVLVSNGVYDAGGAAVYGTMTNRVALVRPITVRSVNGPASTVIAGSGAGGGACGDGAIRCAYVGSGAVLSGFTLTNGFTRSTGDTDRERCGGGAWCDIAGLVTNCVVAGNTADTTGGGVFSGAVDGCTVIANAAKSGGGVHYSAVNRSTLTGNSAADYGGGSYYATLRSCIVRSNMAGLSGGGSYYGSGNNCTFTGNSADGYGGGTAYGSNYNSIVFFNRAAYGSNYYSTTLGYCCTAPAATGTGNISTNPALADSAHLMSNSPCAIAGSAAYVPATDIDGLAWQGPPSIGCAQYVAGTAAGELYAAIQASHTNLAPGFVLDLAAVIDGHASWSRWAFGDGAVLSNSLFASHSWAAPGTYDVTLTVYNDSWPSGVTSTTRIAVVAQPIHYVVKDNPGASTPYATWATAAPAIQDAIGAATVAGALILVTNGYYDAGGVAVYGVMTNRIALTNAVEVRSVNGPADTFIAGSGTGSGGTNTGDGAVRCAYVGQGSTLSGFTLTNGYTRSGGDAERERNGGGVWCTSASLVTNCVIAGCSAKNYGGGTYAGTLSHCALSGNSAQSYGGGAYQSTLNSSILRGNVSVSFGGGSYLGALSGCMLLGNSAASGGGAYQGTLINCTLTGNSASIGGGTYGSVMYNCISYFNEASLGPNYYTGTLRYTCATPLPPGGGNIVSAPLLADFSHLGSGSPCVAAGSSLYTTGADIDGQAWLSPPSMGCDQYVSGASTGTLTVGIQAAYGTAAVGCPVALTALIEGGANRSAWTFGDGSSASNSPSVAHAWEVPGTYDAVLTAWNDAWPGGVSATVQVLVVVQPIFYVAQGNAGATAPYASWETAAATIQDAIDAATLPGSLVLVSNGTYNAGGVAVFGTMTNRVALTNIVTVRSANGPDVTFIVGSGVGSGGTNCGDGAVRCAYVGNGSTLAGFTLTNGYTRSSGDSVNDRCGGGAICGFSATLTNCVLTRSVSSSLGGGSYDGLLYDCRLLANASASGGGASYGTLSGCTLANNTATSSGGGAYNATLGSCTLMDNSATTGGGAYQGTLTRCRIVANSATSGGGAYVSTIYGTILEGNAATTGGGVYQGTLYNCTISGNSAVTGGGAYSATVYNSIVYYNRANAAPNASGGTLRNTCTTPLATGTGNIASEPLLADLAHLSSLSPCIAAGSSTYASGQDFDGQSWLSPPSMGCDQYLAGLSTGELSVAILASCTNAAPGFPIDFTATIAGGAIRSEWSFGDGSSIVTNSPYATHSWSSTGVFEVVLTAYNDFQPGGVSVTARVEIVSQPVHYVVKDNPGAAAPYLSWATAAGSIQDAINAATVPGALVLVSNGVYNAGGAAVYGLMTNRVALTNAVEVRSVNGPQVTFIAGRGTGSGNTNCGDGAVRCAYVGDRATLSGFTLTNGHTRAAGAASAECSGGGTWCSLLGVTSNCIVRGCSAYTSGGGVYGGVHYGSEVSGNAAAPDPQGSGGGAYFAALYNCTLAANRAQRDGGGAWGSALQNCIVYSNATGLINADCSGCTLFDSCTPGASGSGCISNAPLFANAAAGNYRLSLYSPCIDSGTNGAWTAAALDIDGKPRAINGLVDMGAYESDPTITATSASSGALSPSGTFFVAYGTTTNVDMLADPHFRVVDVVVDGMSLGPTNRVTFLGVTSNHVLTAEFAVDQFTLTVASLYGGQTPGTLTANWGTTISQYVTNSPWSLGATQLVCSAASLAGNLFAQVSPTNVTLTLTNDATLTWLWITNVFFSPQSGNHGALSGAQEDWYALGGSVTVTAMPDPHCHFAGWSGDVQGDTNAPAMTLTMDRARSVTANFAFDRHILLIVSARGAASPEAGLYTNDYGSTVPCEITGPITSGATQYVCTGWTIEAPEVYSGAGTSVALVLTNDTILTWNWTTRYWFDLQARGNGSVSPESGWMEAGSNVSVSATAGQDSVFFRWTGDIPAGQKTPTIQLPANRPRSVQANFHGNQTVIQFR